MSFLIELTNGRQEKLYAGTVVLVDAPTHRIRRTDPHVKRVVDHEPRLFGTLDEAKRYGFQSIEEAKIALRMLQRQAKNVKYKIVETQ